MKPDVIVVGAGITGISAANYIVNHSRKRVLIVEAKSVIGGMCRDEYKKGVLYHLYGAHFFHTNNKQVWDFVNKYSDWNLKTHYVKSYAFGRYWNVPILFDSKFQEIPNDKGFGEFFYEIYTKYSMKMWGDYYEELKPILENRVDQFRSVDARYFRDKYQGIPVDGYTKMFENMLNNSRISILLNTKFSKVRKYEDIPTIYTGRLDRLLDSEDLLDFKSIYFDLEERTDNLPFPVINYPTDYDFIKSIDYGLLLNQDSNRTIICQEYPESNQNCNRYWREAYPIPIQKNVELQRNLLNRLADEFPYILPAGRVGCYEYWNMDRCIENAFEVSKAILEIC